jgi:MFS family permease
VTIAVTHSHDIRSQRAVARVPRHGFVIVVMTTLVVVAASSVPSPLYGLYQQRWHISPVSAALVYACYAVGVIAALAGGPTIHRRHPRLLLLAALAAVGLSAVIFSTVQSLWLLDSARVLQGLGTGLVNASAATALTTLHPRGDTGRAAAAASAATAGGIGLGAAVSGALVQWATAPLVTPYLVLLAAAIAVAVALVTVPGAPAWPGPTPSPGATERRLSPRARRALRTASVLAVASWAVTGFYLALGVELTARMLGTDDRAVASLIIAVVQVPAGLVQVLCRRWDNHVAGVVGCATLVVGVSAGIISVALAIAPLFFAAAVLTGSGFGLSFLSGLRIVNEHAGESERSRAIRAFFIFAYLSVSAPTVLAGLAEAQWGLDTTFVAFGALVVVGCIGAGGLVLRHRAQVNTDAQEGSGEPADRR